MGNPPYMLMYFIWENQNILLPKCHKFNISMMKTPAAGKGLIDISTVTSTSFGARLKKKTTNKGRNARLGMKRFLTNTTTEVGWNCQEKVIK